MGNLWVGLGGVYGKRPLADPGTESQLACVLDFSVAKRR